MRYTALSPTAGAANAAKGGGDAAILLANITGSGRSLDMTIGGFDGKFLRYRIAKGDRELAANGEWKAGERLAVPRNSVVLLTTRKVDVAAARSKSAKRVNINGLSTE